MNLEQGRELWAGPCKKVPDLRIVKYRCIAGDRSLPFLACERSGRGAIAGFDGLYPFISRLPNTKRQAALGQIPSGGVEIDGSQLKIDGRGSNGFFFRSDPAPDCESSSFSSVSCMMSSARRRFTAIGETSRMVRHKTVTNNRPPRPTAAGGAPQAGKRQCASRNHTSRSSFIR